MPEKKQVIVSFISLIVIFITIFVSSVYVSGDPVLKQSISFSRCAIVIASLYPMPFSQGNALGAAEDAMFSLLDPFTYREKAERYEFMMEESSGEYSGIGVTISPRDTGLLILAVKEGGPADKAGVKAGDYVIAVNDAKILQDDRDLSVNIIRGKTGTSVKLTIQKWFTGVVENIEIRRQNISLEHIPYFELTKDNIAYIRIDDFEAGTAKDLREAVVELEEKNPVGYIIDLSGNPGGYLNEAVDAADIFLESGQLIVGTEGRLRWNNFEFKSKKDALSQKPVVFLSDGATASAAEILAGAVCGVGRGIIVGDTTYGKGLVQTLFPLPNNDALRLTTARYYFADGRFLNPPDSELSFSGLAPDVVLQSTIEPRFEDMIRRSFFMYDFAEENWGYLRDLPYDFVYPDTVIDMMTAFAQKYQKKYVSATTGTISAMIEFQYFASEVESIGNQLEDMQELSRKLDNDVFYRYRDFVDYHLRKFMAEHHGDYKGVYRHIIIPARADIRLATEILLDPEKYRSLINQNANIASK